MKTNRVLDCDYTYKYTPTTGSASSYSYVQSIVGMSNSAAQYPTAAKYAGIWSSDWTTDCRIYVTPIGAVSIIDKNSSVCPSAYIGQEIGNIDKYGTFTAANTSLDGTVINTLIFNDSKSGTGSSTTSSGTESFSIMHN